MRRAQGLGAAPSRAPSLSGLSVSVLFRCKCVRLARPAAQKHNQQGEDGAAGRRQLRIVGSEDALGAWDPRHAPVLSPEPGSSYFSTSVELPAGAPQVAYKYVLVTSATDRTQQTGQKHSDGALDAISSVEWEPLALNRTLAPASLSSAANVGRVLEHLRLVVTDAEFGDEHHEEHHESLRKSTESSRASSMRSMGRRSFSYTQGALLVILYRLPIIAERDAQTGRWIFAWDDDAIYLTSSGLRRCLESMHRVIWVGILQVNEDIAEDEQEVIQEDLMMQFRCVPVFLPLATRDAFYRRFCKGVLWPLFHMTSQFPINTTSEIDRTLWQTYVHVNRMFCDVVVSLYQGDLNLIWIHDYHLMLLPMQLRRKLTGARIGFFLHIPWPSSEVYRVLPFRDELIRSLLSSTLLGFNLFDYARHFLSSCVRLLNLDHSMKNGNIIINHGGRRSYIRVSHIGIDPERFTDIIGSEQVEREVARLRILTHGANIICGIDDLDAIKGIPFKLLAFEQLLVNFPQYREQLVLYQVAIPRNVPNTETLREEIYLILDRILEDFGTEEYVPVVYVEARLSLAERVALYHASDALLLTPFHDGLNMIPYEFLISARPGRGKLIISEFTGCWKHLFSAVRVNPWNTEELMYTIDMTMQESEEQAAQEQRADLDQRILYYTISRWAESFVKDLGSVEERVMKHRMAIGISAKSAMLELEDVPFLDPFVAVERFRSARRAFFFLELNALLASSGEHDEVLVGEKIWSKVPEPVLDALLALSSSQNVHVYITSNSRQGAMDSLFGSVPRIGLVAESGCFVKLCGTSEWISMLAEDVDVSWLEIAREIMEGYCERTDGSFVESRHASVMWHFVDADPTFGSWQAKELCDHLESVFPTMEVDIVLCESTLCVRPKTLAKKSTGIIMSSVLDGEQKLDFVFTCSSGRSDDGMMAELDGILRGSQVKNVFRCGLLGNTVSSAQFYVRTGQELLGVLAALSQCNQPQ
ncbi:putative alpha,alpha-trehalose-phosphate synthase UDP-forming 7 [Porphyridium purpureum]|uniref:Putative alpha,alpha-trehalose-phosphate synthase UDP-forming 7 n=1 Tax=Porphyridium purpureum TaxID=35688 RepID=A0A5J4YHT7_PORPP|nr:putative alpha,alpha-trehalose-phosphate synthase UDP-forming 7 [Porphyridium purpureum]|eukprot:POR6070..scf251_18